MKTLHHPTPCTTAENPSPPYTLHRVPALLERTGDSKVQPSAGASTLASAAGGANKQTADISAAGAVRKVGASALDDLIGDAPKNTGQFGKGNPEKPKGTLRARCTLLGKEPAKSDPRRVDLQPQLGKAG